MPTPDGSIGSRDLCTGAAVERVIADGGVSSLKISATLESDNFATGSAGWQINRVTGSAEFQDVVVRGTLNADDITVGTLAAARIAVGSLDGDKITTNTLSPVKLETGETGAITITIGTGGIIQSTDVSPDVVINGDGSATFANLTVTGTSSVEGALVATGIAAGNITTGTLSADRIAVNSLDGGKITAGTIDADRLNVSQLDAVAANMGTLNVDETITMGVSGIITMGAGGIIRSAASGQRVEMAETFKDAIRYYADDTRYGSIIGAGTDPATRLELSGHGGAAIMRLGQDGHTQLTGSSFLDIDHAVVKFDDGSSGAPVITFETDEDTGMYRSGTDELAFTAGAATSVRVGDGYLIVSSGALNDKDPRLQDAGTASAPAYSFRGDIDTGIHNGTQNEITFTSAGTNRVWIDATRLACTSSLTYFRVPVKTTTGDPASPSNGDMYLNTSDNTMRIYADAAWRDMATW